MEDIYEKILFSYGLKLYGTQRTRRGLICRTDRGAKELRKTMCDGETIKFESEIKKYLCGKGFTDTDIYLETTEGLPYYQGLENMFVLSNFVQAADMEINEQENAKKAVKTMAQMHKASQGFGSEGKINLGKLPETAKKRKAELIKIKKWINNQSGYSPLDLIIVKNYGYLLERTKRAEYLINSQSYKETVDLAIQRKNICHNNFKGDSVRIKEDGKVYITGFEKSAFDCGVMDLADFLRRQMKEENCTAAKIDELISSYNEVLPLMDFEIEALGAMLLFPSKFFKIFNSCYNKRKVLISEAVLDKLERVIATSEKEEKLLKELKLI